MNIRTLLPLLTSSLLAVLVGCGGDESITQVTQPSASTALTKSEAGDLVDVMAAALGDNYGNLLGRVASPLGAGPLMMRVNAVRTQQSSAFAAVTRPCALGGTASLSQVVSQSNATGGTASFDFTHVNCQAADSRGRVWTVNGDPTLRFVIAAAVNAAASTVTVRLSFDGAVRYRTADRAGRCAMNVALVMEVTGFGTPAQRQSERITGTACGQAVDASIS